MLRDLAQLAQSREGIEVFEVRFAHEIERANRGARIVQCLVESSEPRGDLSALLHVRDELQFALEGVRGRRAIVACLLEIRDCLEGRATRRIELLQNELVGRDRRIHVAHAFGEELRFTQRNARFFGLVDDVRAEATKERRGFVVIFALHGVVDQLLESFAIVTVFQHLQPHLTRELTVRDSRLRNRGGLTAHCDSLRFVHQPIAASREVRDELVVLILVDVATRRARSRSRR